RYRRWPLHPGLESLGVTAGTARGVGAGWHLGDRGLQRCGQAPRGTAGGRRSARGGQRPGRVRRDGTSVVAPWAEFANAAPDLAAFARARMEGRIVYQATLRLDGGPRVHPVSPWLGAGLLCVSFRDTSPKLREVTRDARYALHTAQPWADH